VRVIIIGGVDGK